MLNCAEYRRLLLTDPAHPDPQMLTHVAGCGACARYTDRVLGVEARLARALRVDIGAAPGGVGGRTSGRAPVMGTAGPPRGRRLSPRRRGLAIAASVLLVTFGAGFLWLAAPGRILAAAVVDHMADEPDAWARTQVAVPQPMLDAVLSPSGAHLAPSAGLVSYAQSCEFRGHRVPHLVVQTPAGPVTVMVLVHETVRRGMHFDEQGYRGMIVPVPQHGSLAVLEHRPEADQQTLDAVAAQVLGALGWT